MEDFQSIEGISEHMSPWNKSGWVGSLSHVSYLLAEVLFHLLKDYCPFYLGKRN